MKRIATALVILAGLSMLMPVAGAAQPAGPVARPGSADWVPVAEGLWQRSTPDGRTETYATGAEGLRKALPQLRARLVEAVETFLADPTEDMKQVLDTQTRLIEQVEQGIAQAERRTAQGLSSATAPLAACQRTFNYGAEAQAVVCTTYGDANASYSTNCPESCEVYAYAYTRRTCGNVTSSTSQSCTDSGTNVSCSASVSMNGGFNVPYNNSCFTEAAASIYCQALNQLYLSDYDSDIACKDRISSCTECSASLSE